MKKIKKIFAWVSILSLVLQISGGIFIYQPAFAEEEATPTPEITPSAEPTLEPTPTTEPAPSAEPIPSIEPETTAAPTPTEEITPAPIIEDNQPASENSAPPSETGPPAADNQTPSESPASTDVIPTENGHLSAVILENVAANSLELDLTTEDIGQSASLVTDKADYAPTDTVFISGSGFNPNEAYTLIISSTDEPPVNFETQITADENGAFVYAYQLDGTYRPNYKVEAKDSSGAVIAVATFTDSPPSPTYIVESYSNNTYATVKNDFLQGETVYGKATRSSAAKMRLRYRNPSNSVVHTCGYSDSTVVYCDYALPFNAPTGGWDIQIGRCDDHCNKSDNWTWTGYGEDHFNVAAIPTVSWPTWTTPSCSIDPANDESPASTDLIGDITYPAVGYANDSNYYYFRERVDSDPAGSGGFDQFAWVVLFQKISPNYQYLASLNGKDEKVQFYQNTTEAGAVDFQPLLNDPAEVLVWEGPASIFARITTDGDGKKAVEWAIPKTVIEGAGISSSTTKFFATSANANNFNKDYLNCYEQPAPVCGDGNLDPGEQCDDGNTTPGDGCSSTCQIEQGTLIIRKIIVGSYPGDPGGPEFYPFYFRMDNGQGGVEVKQIETDGQNDEIVNPGTYTVTEEPYNGFTPSYSNCSNIVVAGGGTATCEITNTRDTGTITLDKITQPSADLTQFTLNINYRDVYNTVDLGLYNSFQLADADAPAVIPVPTNWYSTSESLPAGWTSDSVTCIRSDGYQLSPSNFHVDLGSNITCTFTNSRPTCGDGVKNEQEECDGTSGVTSGQNFCTNTCKLIPIYSGGNACSQGKVPVKILGPIEVKSTNPDGPTPATVTLPSVSEYLFEAIGDYGYGGDYPNNDINRADAGYATGDAWSTRRDDLLGIPATAQYRGITSLLSDMGTGLMGIVDWGAYDATHNYKVSYTPDNAGDLDFKFVISDWYDTWYAGDAASDTNKEQAGMWDNAGGININVYECQDQGTLKVQKTVNVPDDLADWEFKLNDGNWIHADNNGLVNFGSLPAGNYTITEKSQLGYYLENVVGCTRNPSNNNSAAAIVSSGQETVCVFDNHQIPVYTGGNSCPVNTVKHLLGTHTIGSQDADGELITEVIAGNSYLFEASGTFRPTSPAGWYSDAAYTTSDNWANLNPQYGIHGQLPDYGAHALLANLGSGVGLVDWGPNSGSHIYGKYLQSNISSPQFVIGDRWSNWYGTPYDNQAGMSDNSGNLTLNVYECQEYGSISGHKFNDLDGNHFWDNGEPVVDGTTITGGLMIFIDKNGNGQFDGLPEYGASIDSLGRYSFGGLTPGSYSICEQEVTGWQRTYPEASNCQTVPVNAGEDSIADFGNFKLGMIQGKKYEDLDSDGTRDAGESYLNGWTIRGYKKNGSNWDPIGEKLTGHTGTTGQYNFDGLNLGQYKICEVLQSGWTQTSPTGSTNRVQTDEAPRCRVMTIDRSGRERTGQHFGNIIQSGSIDGHKYNDLNGNGNQETEEPMVTHSDIPGGVRIFIDSNADGIFNNEERSVFTDNGGYYLFRQLSAGTYDVCEEVPVGWTITSWSNLPEFPNCQRITIVAGENVAHDFGNKLQPITLDLTKSNSVSGSTVTFTLTVHNTSLITAHNVKVKDMLPFGFTYKAGTTKINDVSAADPSIFMMLLTWDLGDMTPNQTKVITFETTIGSLPMGIYPNLAFVLGADRDPCDPAFCTLCYSDFAYSLVTIGWGFSTTTHIGGTVLGASTALPQVLGAATGSETYWLVLAFIIILGGVSIMFMTKKRRAWLLKKMAGISKKLSAFSFFVFLVACFFIFAGSAKATNDSLFIRVADLPEYKNTDNFKLYYTALERESKPISVDCYVEKDGGFGWKTFGGTQTEPSGSCEVFGYELEGDATYRFKAIATSVDGSTESNITQTKIDRSGPEAPKDYSKSRESSTSYKIHWKNPGNEDYGWTRIFASTEQNFTADDATKKADVGGGKDIEFDYVVTGLEPNQDYYFALQGFDKAGNQSGLAGDGGTVTYEVTPAPTQAVAGGVEVVTFPKEEGTGTGGEILGGATEAPTPTEAPVSEGVVAGITSQVGGMNKGWLATGAGILLILAGLGYYFYRRSS